MTNVVLYTAFSFSLSRNSGFPIPKDQSILRIKNLERIIVPTLSIDVKPNKVYDEIIGIKGYADVYDLVGGANAPKKITCVDTKGKKRYQLVKVRSVKLFIKYTDTAKILPTVYKLISSIFIYIFLSPYLQRIHSKVLIICSGIYMLRVLLNSIFPKGI